ncbi:G2/M phase-specific E3 ubiquitin-protein ligase-like isoform X6, partial [Acipenser oxyrinchus oxyrinchus]
GSKRQRDECRYSGYLSDYLLDCEEQETAVSLEDVLMFATGLRSLPPAGIQPQPSMEFFSSSQFPMANTCGNIIRLPYADNYDEFKSAMEFGIKHSPGFGCI